jgi:hypothetical protein
MGGLASQVLKPADISFPVTPRLGEEGDPEASGAEGLPAKTAVQASSVIQPTRLL